jgi:hypothetical protein
MLHGYKLGGAVNEPTQRELQLFQLILTVVQITLDLRGAIIALGPLPEDALNAINDSREKIEEVIERIKGWNEADG